MLLLHFLSATAFASVYTGASPIDILVKRGPNPPMGLEEHQSVIPNTVESGEFISIDFLERPNKRRQRSHLDEATTIPSTVMPEPAKSLPTESPYTYRLMRNPTTVPQVWEEYKYGLNGNPSIESLNTHYGRSWLNSRAELHCFYKRKKIYDYIAKEINTGRSEEETVNELETLRVEQGWSIPTLQEKISTVYFDETSGKLEATSTVYVLSRNLTTVPEVWQEYKHGINGGPSVESLVQEYGTSWLLSSRERIFFSGRKKMYDFIIRGFKDGDPDVVGKLENLRLHNKWPLRMLQLNIGTKSFNLEIADSSTSHYKMLRNLTTVPELWQEYKYGLYGNPSVEHFLTKYNGINWFKSHSDRNYYYKRKKIYDYIINGITEGNEEDQVVDDLEKIRVERGWSLNVLQAEIVTLNFDESKAIKPVYGLCRNLTTVAEVWEEYKNGSNNNPSVESLVQQYGTKWIKSDREARYYYGRKRIYDYILNAVTNGTSEEAAVNGLEGLRLGNNWSLSTLQFNIPSLSIDESTGNLNPIKPIYQLSRNLKTVANVWEEYKNGLNGGPSVESIVQQYGTTWLNTDTERKYYRYRKKIYDYILNAVGSGKSEKDAVNELEEFRIAKGWSIYVLQGKMSVAYDGVKSEVNESLFNEEGENELRLEPPLDGEEHSLFPELSYSL